MILLLVDDNASYRKIIAETLISRGFETFEASTAEAALIICLNITIDVVFTDINLPGMDGNALSKELKRTDSKIRIFFTSAAELSEGFKEEISPEMFIEKSADLNSYVSKLINVMHQPV
jgi:DNA-binding response OmpR family regulator